jgi:hypothetical protein
VDGLVSLVRGGAHERPDCAYEKPLQATDDLSFVCLGLFCGRRRFVWLMEQHSDDDSVVERGIGLAVAAAVEPAVCHPRRRRMGAAPQSFANAASEWLRAGLLSPATMSSSAAVSAPTPNTARGWGARPRRSDLGKQAEKGTAGIAVDAAGRAADRDARGPTDVGDPVRRIRPTGMEQ